MNGEQFYWTARCIAPANLYLDSPWSSTSSLRDILARYPSSGLATVGFGRPVDRIRLEHAGLLFGSPRARAR